eukprot:scaffold24928_cov40-Phaeocystis_antarctica.AAC.1
MLTLLAHERVKERHLVAQVVRFVRVLHSRGQQCHQPAPALAHRAHAARQRWFDALALAPVRRVEPQLDAVHPVARRWQLGDETTVTMTMTATMTATMTTSQEAKLREGTKRPSAIFWARGSGSSTRRDCVEGARVHVDSQRLTLDVVAPEPQRCLVAVLGNHDLVQHVWRGALQVCKGRAPARLHYAWRPPSRRVCTPPPSQLPTSVATPGPRVNEPPSARLDKLRPCYRGSVRSPRCANPTPRDGPTRQICRSPRGAAVTLRLG